MRYKAVSESLVRNKESTYVKSPVLILALGSRRLAVNGRRLCVGRLHVGKLLPGVAAPASTHQLPQGRRVPG